MTADPSTSDRVWSRRRARTIAAVFVVAGAVNAWLVLDPDVPAAARRLAAGTGFVTDASRGVALVLAFGSVLLGRQLSRGKRAAWWIAVVLSVGVAAIQYASEHPIAASVSLGAAVVLGTARRQFRALPDPVTVRRLTALPAAALGAFAVAVASIAVVTVRAGEPLVVTRVATQAVRGLAGWDLGSPTPAPLRLELAIVSGSVLLWVLLVIFWPARDRVVETSDERLRTLVDRSGGTLDYFALRDDKQHVSVREAALGYRYLSGVALATGDPVGDPSDALDVFRAFVRRCDEHGWRPAVLGIGSGFERDWEAAGFKALPLGDEAVVDVGSLRLEGRDRRSLRHAVNRVDRTHRYDLTRVGDLSAPERAELRYLAGKWRHGRVERGFAMALGRVADPIDPDVVVARARRTEDGELDAFLQLVPCRDGYSLDIMRRTTNGPNGLNDFLIVRTAQTLAERGDERLSLNFAVLRGILAADVPTRRWQAPLAAALKVLSRWFQIESLYRFNAKFDPRWEPRFLLYRDLDDVSTIAIAALQAEAFLPVLHRRHRRRARDR